MEPPISTFRELSERDLEIRVVCQRCGHEAVLDSASPGLRDRRLAGQRFRCSQVLTSGKACGGVGLPSIDRPGLGKARLWPQRMIRRSQKPG